MTTANDRAPAALRDVLYEFSISAERPDAALLDEFVKRYPTYAAELTDFAVEMIIDSDRDERFEAPDVSGRVSPAVSRAVSKYQNALHARIAGKTAQASAAVASANECGNPFASLDRQSFRNLANELNVTLVFLCKLRDCLIDPKTITDGFRRYLAEKMKVSTDWLATFWETATPRLQSQFFKAEKKPEASSIQSFEEAVHNSGLDQGQQDFLLGL
jgi:hypothetical protein